MAKNNLNVPSKTTAAKVLAKEVKKAKKPKVTKCKRVKHYWAVVERDGTLVRGCKVKRVKRLSEGIYEVVFKCKVNRGVYVATIGRPGIATEPTGEITVALRCCLTGSEANRGVWVDTHDSNGNFSDRAFHLVVHTD